MIKNFPDSDCENQSTERGTESQWIQRTCSSGLFSSFMHTSQIWWTISGMPNYKWLFPPTEPIWNSLHTNTAPWSTRWHKQQKHLLHHHHQTVPTYWWLYGSQVSGLKYMMQSLRGDKDCERHLQGERVQYQRVSLSWILNRNLPSSGTGCFWCCGLGQWYPHADTFHK